MDKVRNDWRLMRVFMSKDERAEARALSAHYEREGLDCAQASIRATTERWAQREGKK